ncbi:MAG: acyltransferase family protein [Ruminococcus sp.]|nr:acyltransferase family protein [Ruminococcus sp.]
MATGKRIEWVDIGKFICIMFVMVSHLESGSEVLDVFYKPFFLTVFFFLSGYVYKQPVTLKEHFIKKVKGLFVPWLIFSNFNILLSAVISLHGERNTLCELGWNLLQIREYGDGVWFVAALFVAFIPFYFIIKWNKPRWACVLSVVLSLISVLYSRQMNPEILPWGSTALPWHLEYIFQAMLWMVLGYYFRLYGEETFDKLNTLLNRAILWVVYLIGAYIPEAIGGGVLVNARNLYNRYYWFRGVNINLKVK